MYNIVLFIYEYSLFVKMETLLFDPERKANLQEINN